MTKRDTPEDAAMLAGAAGEHAAVEPVDQHPSHAAPSSAEPKRVLDDGHHLGYKKTR